MIVISILVLCGNVMGLEFTPRVAAAEFERNPWGGDTFNLVVESPSMLLDAGIISSELKDYCQSIWYVMFFAYLCAN